MPWGEVMAVSFYRTRQIWRRRPSVIRARDEAPIPPRFRESRLSGTNEYMRGRMRMNDRTTDSH
jgi:hypothetical protein